MKKEEFYFDSRDNATKIHAVRWTPDSENIVGVVQLVHGMAEYVERYEELARFLTEKNYAVTGEDHLGHGKSVPKGGTKGYFCKQDPATTVVRDVHRLKKLTQEVYPGVPYFILGHSMGSFIVRNYICRYGTGIDGTILSGTGMQPKALLMVSKMLATVEKTFKGEKHVSTFLDKAAFGAYNKRIDNPKTAYDWLTKEEAIVDRYIKDEDCGFTFTVNGFQTLFEFINRLLKKKNLAKVPKNLPVFMIAGDMDPVGNYGEGVKKAYQSLKEQGLTDITLKLYENDRHEILNETDRNQVMQDIAGWLSKHLVIPESI